MNIETASQIPLTDLLSRLGHQPVRIRKGYEYWYLSPFRAEKTPSFKVNINMNFWKDFGLMGLYHKPDKGGGNIFDFVMHYNSTRSMRETLRYLRELNILGTAGGVNVNRAVNYELARNQKEENPIKLVRVKKLENPSLEKYISGRAIDLNIARHYLRECYYQSEGKGWGAEKKPWFGVGMETDSKSYEIRSKYSKIVAGGKKDVTTLRYTDAPCLNVFEGFMDFLSLLTIQKKKSLEGTTMILHSANMVKKAIWYAKNFNSKKILTYLDNDKAGEAAYEKLEKELPGYSLIRGNALYKDHKDLNDYLMFMHSQKAGLSRNMEIEF